MVVIGTLEPATDQQRRIAAAVAALAPNSRRVYRTAWEAWQHWAPGSGAAAAQLSG